jgi:hypothetical protein
MATTAIAPKGSRHSQHAMQVYRWFGFITLLCLPAAVLGAPYSGNQRSATGSHSVGVHRWSTLSTTQRSTVSLPKVGAASSGMNSDLRQAEHMAARSSASRGNMSAKTQSGAGRQRASAISFSARPPRLRGSSNSLGKGSGSKRYGVGRRITEKQR